MDVIYRRCCGLDVHKDSVSACVLVAEPTGRTVDTTASGWRSTQVAITQYGVMTHNDFVSRLAEPYNRLKYRVLWKTFSPVSLVSPVSPGRGRDGWWGQGEDKMSWPYQERLVDTGPRSCAGA